MTNRSLSNIQLELLKIFSHDVSESDLQEVTRLLSKFFAEKAISGADKHWDDSNWSEKKVKELLKSHKRTPYLKNE